MRNTGKFREIRSCLASAAFLIALAFAGAFLIVGARVQAATTKVDARVADGDTSGKYTSLLDTPLASDNEKVGKVWTDKTVYANAGSKSSTSATQTVTIDGYSEKFSDDFLEVFSALGSAETSTRAYSDPVDLVIALDISGSMGSAENPSTMSKPSDIPEEKYQNPPRMYNLLKAANQLLTAFLSANEYNRACVIVYDSTAYVLMPLAHYSQYRTDKNTATPFLSGKTNYMQKEYGQWACDITATWADPGSGARKSNTVTSWTNTNTMAGYYAGMKELCNASTSLKVTTPEGVEKTLYRSACMILLTDGQANATLKGSSWMTASQYSTTSTKGMNTEIEGDSIPTRVKVVNNRLTTTAATNNTSAGIKMYGHGSYHVFTGKTSWTILKTMMCAAYMKAQVKEHYGSSRFKLYTYGYDLDYNVDRAVINSSLLKDYGYIPSKGWALWNNVTVSSTINLTGHTDADLQKAPGAYQIWNYLKSHYSGSTTIKTYTPGSKRLNVSETFTANSTQWSDISNNINYVDKYTDVETSGLSVESAFRDILNSETKVTADFRPLSGNLVYEEPIGDFMEVKNVNYLYWNGICYPLSYQSGSSTSNNKVYTTSSYVKSTQYQSGSSFNLNTIKVEVTGTSGSQTIKVTVPQDALPVDMLKITYALSASGNEGTWVPESYSKTSRKPLRVSYTVGIADDYKTNGSVDLAKVSKKDSTYIKNHSSGGDVYFYPTKYSRSSYSYPLGSSYKRGDAKVTYNAGRSNPYYVVQNPMYIEGLASGSIWTEKDDISDTTTCYFRENVAKSNKTTSRAWRSRAAKGFGSFGRSGTEVGHYLVYYNEATGGTFYYIGGDTDYPVHVRPGASACGDMHGETVSKSSHSTATSPYCTLPTITLPLLSYASQALNSTALTDYLGNNGRISVSTSRLFVSKEVQTTSGTAPSGDSFAFKVTFSGSAADSLTSVPFVKYSRSGSSSSWSAAGVSGTLTLTNKAVTFNLKNNEGYDLILPANIVYKVEETISSENAAKGYKFKERKWQYYSGGAAANPQSPSGTSSTTNEHQPPKMSANERDTEHYINTYIPTGRLFLSKEIQPKYTGATISTSDSFTLKVTLSGTNLSALDSSVPYTKYTRTSATGSWTKASSGSTGTRTLTTSGSTKYFTISVKHNEGYDFTLPESINFKVEETSLPTYYTCAGTNYKYYSGSAGSTPTSVSGTSSTATSKETHIVSNGRDAVHYVNTYDPRGSLFVSKEVVEAYSGITAPSSNYFTYKVTFSGTGLDQLSSPLSCTIYTRTSTSGSWTKGASYSAGLLTSGNTKYFTYSSMTKNKGLKIDNLPVGITYKVEETSMPAGYTFRDGTYGSTSSTTPPTSFTSGTALSLQSHSGTISTRGYQYWVNYVNTYNPRGSLFVSKGVEDAYSGVAAPASDNFTYRVTFSGTGLAQLPASISYTTYTRTSATGSWSQGTSYKTSLTTSGSTKYFTYSSMTKNKGINIENLPIGITYKVEETSMPADYRFKEGRRGSTSSATPPSSTGSGTQVSDRSYTGTIATNGYKYWVHYINTYAPGGNLFISKEVYDAEGHSVGSPAQFTFRVTLSGASAGDIGENADCVIWTRDSVGSFTSQTPKSVKFEGGSAGTKSFTYSIRKEQGIEITKLPPGITYTVEEIEIPKYYTFKEVETGLQTGITGAPVRPTVKAYNNPCTGTIEKNNRQLVQYINTFTPPGTGSLFVAKEVTGAENVRTAEAFDFTIRLNFPGDFNGTIVLKKYKKDAVTNKWEMVEERETGKQSDYTVSLGNREGICLEGLWPGTGYTVDEGAWEGTLYTVNFKETWTGKSDTEVPPEDVQEGQRGTDRTVNGSIEAGQCSWVDYVNECSEQHTWDLCLTKKVVDAKGVSIAPKKAEFTFKLSWSNTYGPYVPDTIVYTTYKIDRTENQWIETGRHTAVPSQESSGKYIQLTLGADEGIKIKELQRMTEVGITELPSTDASQIEAKYKWSYDVFEHTPGEETTGWSNVTGAIGTSASGTVSVQFVNLWTGERDPGSLFLSKEVLTDEIAVPEEPAAFRFRVTLYGDELPGSVSYTKYTKSAEGWTAGAMETAVLAPAGSGAGQSFEVTLTDRTAIEMTGLAPDVSWTAEELEPPQNYRLDHTETTGATGVPVTGYEAAVSGVVEEGQRTEAAYFNRYCPPTSLRIWKRLEDPTGLVPEEKEYTFELVLKEDPGSPMTASVYRRDGDAWTPAQETKTLSFTKVAGDPGNYGEGYKTTFTLRKDESILLQNLPNDGTQEGRVFWVRESGADSHFRIAAEVNGEPAGSASWYTGQMDLTQENTVAFTNTYDYSYQAADVTLQVNKVLEYASGPRSDSFAFVLEPVGWQAYTEDQDTIRDLASYHNAEQVPVCEGVQQSVSGSGSANFGPIQYREETLESLDLNTGVLFLYRIYEKQPTDTGRFDGAALEGAQKTLEGKWRQGDVEYDDAVRYIAVLAKRHWDADSDGVVFEAQVLSEPDGLPAQGAQGEENAKFGGQAVTFTNRVLRPGILTLDGTKSLVDADGNAQPLTGDEFEFTIEGVSYTPAGSDPGGTGESDVTGDPGGIGESDAAGDPGAPEIPGIVDEFDTEEDTGTPGETNVPGTQTGQQETIEEPDTSQGTEVPGIVDASGTEEDTGAPGETDVSGMQTGQQETTEGQTQSETVSEMPPAPDPSGYIETNSGTVTYVNPEDSGVAVSLDPAETFEGGLPPVSSSLLTCQVQYHTHTEDCFDEEGNNLCGYVDYVVHKHTADCYDASGALVCPLPEIEAHTHREDCYSDGNVLVCGMEERAGHTHSASCYVQRPRLVCGQEERAGHTHSESCRSVRTTLICGLDDDPEHVHTDACWETEVALTCGQQETPGHMHTEACYRYEDVLVCGQEESAGHVHTAACYSSGRTLTCGKPEIVLHTHTEKCYAALPEDEYHTHDESCYDAHGWLVCGGRICGMTEVLEHVHDRYCFTGVSYETAGQGQEGRGADNAEQTETPDGETAGTEQTETPAGEVSGTEQGTPADGTDAAQGSQGMDGPTFDGMDQSDTNQTDTETDSTETTPDETAAVPMPEQTTVRNDGSGMFHFGPITYEIPGVYTYEIRETRGEDTDGTAYDATVYTVTVTVTRNQEDGTLNIRKEITKQSEGSEPTECGEIKFVNTKLAPKLTIVKTQTVGDATGDTLSVEGKNRVTYRLTVTNEGNGPAKNVTVTDLVPKGTPPFGDLALVPGTARIEGQEEQNVTEENDRVTWNLGTLEAGASRTVTFQAQVPSIGADDGQAVWENTGSVTAEGQESETSNTVEISADGIEIEKEQVVNETDGDGARTKETRENPRAVHAGDTVTYYLTVTNRSAAPATGVVVTDKIPETAANPDAPESPMLRLELVAGSISDGGAESGGIITWNLGTLAGNEKKELHFSVKVPTASRTLTWENIAAVSTNGISEPEDSNEVAVREEVGDPALEITKTQETTRHSGPTADTLDVIAGETVTYTLRVSNTSRAAADHVVITDTVPAGEPPLVLVPGSAKFTSSGKIQDAQDAPETGPDLAAGKVTEGADGRITWTLAELPPQWYVEVSFTATVPKVTGDTTWTNVGSVQAENIPEEHSNEVYLHSKPVVLRVTKVVEADEGVEIPEDSVFTFCLEKMTGGSDQSPEWSPEAGAAYTIEEQAGEPAVTGDDGTFTLKKGQTARFEGLESGTWRVTEQKIPDGYEIKEADQLAQRVLLTQENPQQEDVGITFTNVYRTNKAKLRLKKVDAKDESALSGVIFVLEKLDGEGSPDPSFGRREVTTKADGTADFSDLEEGTYRLTETRTAAGYNLLAEPIEIAVTRSAPDGWKITADGQTLTKDSEAEEGYDLFTLTVQNRKRFGVPATGSWSSYLLVLGGMILTGLASILYLLLRRRRAA